MSDMVHNAASDETRRRMAPKRVDPGLLFAARQILRSVQGSDQLDVHNLAIAFQEEFEDVANEIEARELK